MKDDDLIHKLAKDVDTQADLNSVVLEHPTTSSSSATPDKSYIEHQKQKTPKSTRETTVQFEETEIDSSLLTPKEEKV